jgi:hypothetical protein
MNDKHINGESHTSCTLDYSDVTLTNKATNQPTNQHMINPVYVLRDFLQMKEKTKVQAIK